MSRSPASLRDFGPKPHGAPPDIGGARTLPPENHDSDRRQQLPVAGMEAAAWSGGFVRQSTLRGRRFPTGLCREVVYGFSIKGDRMAGDNDWSKPKAVAIPIECYF